MLQKKKIEFGDFQTPTPLAEDVINFLKGNGVLPSAIVEPTCGVGAFLKASNKLFGKSIPCWGFDINQDYLDKLKKELPLCSLENSDFFQKDWLSYFSDLPSGELLLIGNPPWVTNSAVGTLKGKNLPEKTNFQGLKGFSAKTGKANFDIAEWMLIQLLQSLKNRKACLAMLCKTATARKVLKHLWINDIPVNNSSLHLIDAKKHFDVSVDACLFITYTGDKICETTASIYSDFSFSKKITTIGLHINELISNIEDYKKYREIDGFEYYKWRSGVKHDASKVMELNLDNDSLINGFGEVVEIENDYLFPLLKSSDIGNNRLKPRKYVIVTQRNVGDDTEDIKNTTPKTWNYLVKHSDILDGRKSIIYKKRQRFSVFGIGNYSFSPWKVVISGFYKNISFSIIGTYLGKPIMVDDTCYSIACKTEKEASFIAKLLNSDVCKKFLGSLIFLDAKRPINIDVLKRIDLYKLSQLVNCEEEAYHYLSHAEIKNTSQLQFVFEKQKEYEVKSKTYIPVALK